MRHRNHERPVVAKVRGRFGPAAVPYALAALFFAIYSAHSLLRHRRMETHAYDLGLFEQVVRAYSNLEAPVSDIRAPGFNVLGEHFHPILALLAPIYRVFPGPGTLLALLRTVAFGWQQDSLLSSARELLALGQELYRRLATLGTHTAKMGRSLHATVESYNQFVGALESRVLVTARRMQELDVVTDELPHLVPVETGPRVLTAIELLEAVGAEDERPDLLLDVGDGGTDAAAGTRDDGDRRVEEHGPGWERGVNLRPGNDARRSVATDRLAERIAPRPAAYASASALAASSAAFSEA